MLGGMRSLPPSCLPVLLLIAALARPGAAQSADETTRWVPSLGGTGGIVGQSADASVTSSGITYLLTSRTAPNPNTEVVTVTTVTNSTLRPPVDGNDVLVTP